MLYALYGGSTTKFGWVGNSIRTFTFMQRRSQLIPDATYSYDLESCQYYIGIKPNIYLRHSYL